MSARNTVFYTNLIMSVCYQEGHDFPKLLSIVLGNVCTTSVFNNNPFAISNPSALKIIFLRHLSFENGPCYKNIHFIN